MKFTALCLFSAVYAAAYTLATDLQAAAATSPSLSEEAAPEPTLMSAEDYAILDARQAATQNLGATLAVVQFPTVTTDWRITVLANGQTTYWEDAYTQTFGKVPGQLPSPGVGSIGYGTLSKKNGKRAEATAVATVIAQPIVMLMQTTIIVQPVQRVTEVQIVENVIEYATPAFRSNATAPLSASFYPSGTGVFLGTGTAASSGFSGMPIPTNGSAPWTFKRLV